VKPRRAAKGGGARPWRRRIARIALAAVLVLLLLPPLQVLAVRWFDPPITGIELQRRVESWRSGAGSGGVSRAPLPIEQIPRYYLRCVVTAEDSRFLAHRGFDWREMREAAARAKRTGRPARGASTITMQCARTLFLWQGRSWIRKGLEAYYTLWMEWLLPKRRILELYLNQIEMGKGIYGIGAAARHHYGREPWELAKSQQAMLAALLPAPRTWNPRAPSVRLRWRQNLIRAREPMLVFPPWGRGAEG